jgi:hypothetical protein
MEDRMEQISRRRFIAAGAAIAGGVLGPASGALGAPRTRTVYRLDTGCGSGCSCHACEKHAANKLFGDVSAVRRAHRGCNCAIVQGELHAGTYNAVFAYGAEVDRRSNRVRAILRNHEPIFA